MPPWPSSGAPPGSPCPDRHARTQAKKEPRLPPACPVALLTLVCLLHAHSTSSRGAADFLSQYSANDRSTSSCACSSTGPSTPAPPHRQAGREKGVCGSATSTRSASLVRPTATVRRCGLLLLLPALPNQLCSVGACYGSVLLLTCGLRLLHQGLEAVDELAVLALREDGAGLGHLHASSWAAAAAAHKSPRSVPACRYHGGSEPCRSEPAVPVMPATAAPVPRPCPAAPCGPCPCPAHTTTT